MKIILPTNTKMMSLESVKNQNQHSKSKVIIVFDGKKLEMFEGDTLTADFNRSLEIGPVKLFEYFIKALLGTKEVFVNKDLTHGNG